MEFIPPRLPAACRLDEYVAVVTGAAGGIGSAIIEMLASLGARVACLDLERAVPELQQRIASFPTKCIAVACDVTDDFSVQAAAAQVKEQLGACNVLVNNAGILPPHSALQDVTPDSWERSMAVNLRGPFLCTRAFGVQMLERRQGTIVNIASISAQQANAAPAYSVSKAALLALTRHTAVEWGPRGVRTNSVSPGFLQTALSAKHYANSDLLQRRIDMVPMRRLGTTTEVANVVAFLASQASSFVNGQDIVADGGFLGTALMHAQDPAEQYGGFRN
jgi:NAD(P)-dependent dehydrogenase (short-subunit alcohol dehydrogenase family)